MAIMDVFFGLWQILTLNVPSLSYELDEETRERMKQREEMLNGEMTRLWQEVEEQFRQQRSQEHSAFAWASPLFSALQHWQCWAVAGVLVLLFGLCWWRRKRSREPEREEESSDNDVEEEEAEEDNEDANDLGRFIDEHIQRPVQNQDRECIAVKKLVERFIFVFKYVFFNPWYPVLGNAIRVGSAFQGWSPHEDDITYRLLVPLKPPRGHIFHLEPCLLLPTRNFRIRMELVCTCEMEQPAGETRCFLHDPEKKQRRKGGRSILQDLCTDSYLDVQKIAYWFQNMVRRSWRVLPESSTHRLTVLPSERSCKFQVSQGQQKSFLIELMFGVQQGDSDIFLSSQYAEAAYTPSTMWPESYDAAEMKFFRHIARQARPDSVHLRCLQLCTCIQLGTEISTYTLKTIVMHLLTTIPLSKWGSRDFLERLEDILQYLQSCLEERRLKHLFVGNENVPDMIILPQALRTSEPLNLFQHLKKDPYAYEDAWLDFLKLRLALRRLVLHGG